MQFRGTPPPLTESSLKQTMQTHSCRKTPEPGPKLAPGTIFDTVPSLTPTSFKVCDSPPNTKSVAAMASDSNSRPRPDLTASNLTIPSDSENYGNHDLSSSPPSASSSPVILYKPPTVWSLFRGAVINLFLPFVNGLMLGFGELVAHEVAFRFGWSQTKVRIHQCSERGQ
jgi:Outer membrane protein TOM13